MRILGVVMVAIGGLSVGFSIGNAQAIAARAQTREAIKTINECVTGYGECAQKLLSCEAK